MMRFEWIAVLPLLFAVGCVDQAEKPVEPGRSDTSDLLSRTDVTSEEVIVIPADAEPVYDPPGERIKVYTDFDLFDDATGELTEIGFDGLPGHGSSCPGPAGDEDSIPNPIVREGVTFLDDPWCLESWYCPEQTCPGAGILLVIHTWGTIDFPSQTGGAMLAVEGLGDGPFILRVVDGSGGEIQLSARGITSGTSYAGFTSSSGITRIQFLGAITHGNLPLRHVYFGQLPEEFRPTTEPEGVER